MTEPIWNRASVTPIAAESMSNPACSVSHSGNPALNVVAASAARADASVSAPTGPRRMLRGRLAARSRASGGAVGGQEMPHHASKQDSRDHQQWCEADAGVGGDQQHSERAECEAEHASRGEQADGELGPIRKHTPAITTDAG